MSWESLYCKQHQVEAEFIRLEGEPSHQTAIFRCPFGGEELRLHEHVARDTSHLPVYEIPVPDGLDPLPEDPV